MVFSSITFLYYFLPCALLLYFITPGIALKNMVLLITSLAFYGWGEPRYLIIMLVTILVDYLCGILISASQKSRVRKLILAFSVIFSLGILAYFKYANFFIDNFNAVTGLSVPILRITLPVGISFYTFQTMSYVVDVYRRDVDVQKNPLSLGMYITMFPQLIAGPIVRYSDIVGELDSRKHSFEKVSCGITRFVLGLSKKVLIADVLAQVCDKFNTSNEKSVLFYWLYAVAFSLQIYFDFSGYSDMAIGMGKILGFDFPENFNYPYISRSVTEFWRRWHMTLGTWFRDYLYIPLGGNRVKLVRWIFNILVVWMATGFWHGAAWNFIIWGLMFAILLIIEKPFLKRSREGGRSILPLTVISHIYVLFAVMISFVIFNAPSLKEAGIQILSLFGYGDIPLVTTPSLYYLKSYAFVFIMAFIGATPIVKKGYLLLKDSSRLVNRILEAVEPIALLALLAVVTAHLVDSSFSPFLYFRF